jgi:hypothetical protein
MKVIDRNYGSIPHLSDSKLTQQADKKISIGQELILTKKARDWKDLIIVTEKIDGTNVGVICKDGALIPLTRSGYNANTSNFKQHHLFSKWVSVNHGLFDWLPEGWRVCGEWCIMAHGTIYDITDKEPFVAFDIIDDKNKRIPYLDFFSTCCHAKIAITQLLHIGQPISIKNSIKLLDKGHYGNPDKPEGFVYRVERGWRVDFLAKWVRHDKQDGKYLGDKEVWNKGAEKYL